MDMSGVPSIVLVYPFGIETVGIETVDRATENVDPYWRPA